MTEGDGNSRLRMVRPQPQPSEQQPMSLDPAPSPPKPPRSAVPEAEAVYQITAEDITSDPRQCGIWLLELLGQAHNYGHRELLIYVHFPPEPTRGIELTPRTVGHSWGRWLLLTFWRLVSYPVRPTI